MRIANLRLTIKFVCALLFSSQAYAAVQVQYLGYPNQYLAAAYTAILQAKQEIALSYYELDPCSTTTKVLVKAMAEVKAARPAVRVVIIADSYPFSKRALIPSFTAGAFAEYLARQKMELKLYNPPELGRDANHRSHAKYLVVDGKSGNGILLTGSSNLADSYFSMKSNGLNYINRDVMVTGGNLAAKAREHFLQTWNNGAAGSAVQLLPGQFEDYQRSCLGWGAREDALLAELKANAAATVSAVPLHQCPNGAFAADPYGPSDKPTKWMIFDFLRKPGTKKLLVENYIYAPTMKLAEALSAARARIPTLIYTNYYQNSGEVFENVHNAAIQRDSRGKTKILSFPSIDYPSQHWSQSGRGMFFQNHSKIMVSNEENILVSSFNLDNRSSNINVESSVVFYSCPDLAKEAEQITAQLLTQLPPDLQTALNRRANGNGVNVDSNIFTDIRDLFGSDLY